MQMCETTDRNRIVKAEGVEASWHMTAKPTGSTPTVNAAFVHRQFATLTVVKRCNLPRLQTYSIDVRVAYLVVDGPMPMC